MLNPKLSVIVPVYNAEERIYKTISSIISQEYKEMEIIVINDGSKDNSLSILEELSTKDNRIKIFNQDNRGVSFSRNQGLKYSTGDYITFIDSDDTVENVNYKSIIDEMVHNNIDLFIFGMSFDYYLENKLLKKINYSFHENKIINLHKFNKYFFELYNVNYLSSVCNKIFSAKIIKEQKIEFETKMAILEDFAFNLDYLKSSNQILISNQVSYHYYHNLLVNNLSKRADIDYLKSFRILEDKLETFKDIIQINSKKDNEKISTMIFAIYLIGIKKTFVSAGSIREKYEKIIQYSNNHSFMNRLYESNPSSTQRKLIRFLFLKKLYVFLFFVFEGHVILNILKTTYYKYFKNH